jgi:hypothetical protein
LAVLVVCVVGGCSRGPKKYQVSGKVHYKDGSIPKAAIAVVTFQPAKDSTAEVRQAASGAISADGTFEMYTRELGDGVYAGDYVVVFNIAKAVMDPQPLVIEKYRNPAMSPYKQKVDRNITDLDFTIEPLPGVTGKAAG